MKPFIRMGDKTSHGGTVVERFPTTRISGRPMAGMFHKVTCPKCGDNYIAEGDPSMTVDGRHPARDGHKTACGATLISSQFTTSIDAPGGTGIGAASTAAPAAAWATAAQPAASRSLKVAYISSGISGEGLLLCNVWNTTREKLRLRTT